MSAINKCVYEIGSIHIDYPAPSGKVTFGRKGIDKFSKHTHALTQMKVSVQEETVKQKDVVVIGRSAKGEIRSYFGPLPQMASQAEPDKPVLRQW